MQRHYSECKVSSSNIPLFVANELQNFCDYDFHNIYRKCGYVSALRFNPATSYNDIDLQEKFGFI